MIMLSIFSSSLPSPGLQEIRSIHSDSGASTQHCQALLEDGQGARSQVHCDAVSSERSRQGKVTNLQRSGLDLLFDVLMCLVVT